jgi:D-tyrosyl-tRNA(Tyr) deacylase
MMHAQIRLRVGKDGKTAVIGLLQRVSEASVTVSGQVIADIGRGLAVLVAVQPDDTRERVQRMADRVLGYRVFPDAEGRMNESLLDQGLELLLVPQFTLAADTRKGTRASFTRAAAPEIAEEYFGLLLQYCRQMVPGTCSGEFAAYMQVALVNDGPVTFWLET